MDGRIVPIDYKVKTGEIVDIIMSSNPNKGPSRDWLKIVFTSEARSKIRSWYKKERREENIVEGRTEVEREFRRNFIRLNDDAMADFLKSIAERLRFNTIDDFYAAIGYGGVSISRHMPKIKDDYNKLLKSSRDSNINIVPEKRRSKSTEGVEIEGIHNCLIQF